MDYDVVLYGITGFTGRLVLEYFLESAPSNCKWAVAGRSKEKLDQVISEAFTAVKITPRELPVIIADSTNRDSLLQMCKKTRVIITTVGPYIQYGLPLVEACVETGTDYCDLTGEAAFIQMAITKYQKRALETGARIVSCCGYDSIPSDLGTFMMVREMEKRYKSPCSSVQHIVQKCSGGVSSGTMLSGIALMESVGFSISKHIASTDPYMLCRTIPGFKHPDILTTIKNHVGILPHFNFLTYEWEAPFVMAAVNSLVVHRSNALFEFSKLSQSKGYGNSFLYSERVNVGKAFTKISKLPKPVYFVLNFFFTMFYCFSLGLLFLLMLVPPLRSYARSRIQPNSGPSREVQRKARFESAFIATSANKVNGEHVILKGEVSAQGDPGYFNTARMISETALCLAFDVKKTNSKTALSHGFLTPAAACGDALLTRLRKIGFKMEIIENKKK